MPAALACPPAIRPFDAPCGAEVIGLDLARPLSDVDFARVRRAHLDHHVLVFRDMAITRAQQVAFSRFERSTRDAFVYRHRWQPGDMVFWDNRSLMHLAAGTPDHLRRRLNRTTIEGDAPY